MCESITERFYSNPQILNLNQDLLKKFGLESFSTSIPDLAHLLTTGFSKAVKTKPVAQAYAGHQFGHYVPQLGDGRAVLVGELFDTKNKRFDLHLKGSGQTKFSRAGDGRATLSSVIREYILSEALYGLNIPTTRSLSISLTGENVAREKDFPGAVLARIASSHLRVGSFQYAKAQSQDHLVKLANYVIQRHDSGLRVSTDLNIYQQFYQNVINRQKSLILNWMNVGFIHGVMNTDNMTISGETIDFGPCAFMDHFDPNTVFSFIDKRGRYAYANQPAIAQWNLMQLGLSLSSLFSDDEKKSELFIQKELERFGQEFESEYVQLNFKKLGLDQNSDSNLVNEFYQLLYKYKADYTWSFRSLSQVLRSEPVSRHSLLSLPHDDIQTWKKNWLKNFVSQNKADQLDLINPAVIPRNHLVENALHQAVEFNNFTEMEKLLEALKNPFTDHLIGGDWMRPPTAEEKVNYTFCGT